MYLESESVHYILPGSMYYQVIFVMSSNHCNDSNAVINVMAVMAVMAVMSVMMVMKVMAV